MKRILLVPMVAALLLTSVPTAQAGYSFSIGYNNRDRQQKHHRCGRCGVYTHSPRFKHRHKRSHAYHDRKFCPFKKCKLHSKHSRWGQRKHRGWSHRKHYGRHDGCSGGRSDSNWGAFWHYRH
ncbi:hypothetical protein ACFL1E_03550 [Candidatus Omnitrophota bacterium]